MPGTSSALRIMIASQKPHFVILQDQYVNFLATVGPFIEPALDLVSYVNPGDFDSTVYIWER